MNNFSGKKALCFIALPHHNRFLVPIMDALRAQGMETKYFTVAAEGAFEITLNQANLPYRHVMDYVNEQTSLRVLDGYNELRSVWQEKILSSHTFQSVPIIILDKVVRSAVENFHALDRMLEVEKPDLLFALHEINPWGKMLGYLSHVRRIPYFTLQEGLYYSDINYLRFHTDYSTACLVWGDQCREVLRKAGCSDDKMFAVGNTHIWNIKPEAVAPESIAKTKLELGVAPDKKIILFLMSYSHYHPFDARIFLDWMKARGDVVAVFKWHPLASKEIIARALEKMPKESPVISLSNFDTYRLIGASDVCITVGNSTTGLEALAFGKPLIEMRLADQDYSFSAQGVAERAGGFEDFGEQCHAILSGGLTEARRRQVEKYLAHNFAYQDNQTMDRIVDLVSESLGARANAEAPATPIKAACDTAYPCTIVLPVDDAPVESVLATLEAIAAHTPADLYEVVIVNCASRPETRQLFAALAGDVKVISGEPGWSYGQAANRAVADSQGKYLVFSKPGLVPSADWLTGLIRVAEDNAGSGVVGGQLLHTNGLLWHIGVAFDVNQSPFSIYRFLKREFLGAQKQRQFKAVEFPFLLSRELFCQLGGFNAALHNRFEDIDFCLRVQQHGRTVVYTPDSTTIRQSASWLPNPIQDQTNCIRFYSQWTGMLWQDDEKYLEEDGLTHDALSMLYRDLAARVAQGAKQSEMSMGA